MNPAPTIALPGELSESQRNALLKLLADEDPAIFRTVRQTIVAHGQQSVEWLRAYTLSDDPVLRGRAQAIIRHFERKSADDRFLGFCLRHGEDFDLEEGTWLLASSRYPEASIEGYQALLDSYAADVRENAGPKQKKPIDLLGALNEFLFDDLGFAGNEENYYDPENSYLNRVLDRRTGNPINLCLLYILLARRLRLPVVGIGLPGHFICRYQSTSSEVYIDVFSRGKLLTKADCVQYLLQGNYSVRDEYLAPVTPRRMLLRICGNLHQIFLHLQDEAEATRFQRYLVALAK
jgi:regulator of sirC expression with transglutaminase-like and TPR domain